MLCRGDVISHHQMCAAEGGATLQRGMNFRLHRGHSVLLMSVRPRAPYRDRVEDEGHILIYEGHDVPACEGGPDPKTLDQPAFYPSGKPTQNGLFHEAAVDHKEGRVPAEHVRVYEKIKTGIWVYNGLFRLADSWLEESEGRQVFKFRLELIPEVGQPADDVSADLEHERLIPSRVKLEVWKRDGGRCVKCGSADNLHFDHIIPFSKGGSSLVPENIQLLCARHNLAKRDRIE